MVIKKCPVCNEPTGNPIEAAFEHFRFYEPGQFRYWKGNIRAFGLIGGLQASICLSFPFYNTIVNWEHRKKRLEIGGQR